MGEAFTLEDLVECYAQGVFPIERPTRTLSAMLSKAGGVSIEPEVAVVTVKRDACGGCFNRIPPQRQVDIRQGKKIIICEYCGRILVADPDETQE